MDANVGMDGDVLRSLLTTGKGVRDIRNNIG